MRSAAPQDTVFFPAYCQTEEDKQLFLRLRKTKTLLLTGTDAEAKRREILDYFHATVDLEEKLYSVFNSDETFYVVAEKLRHPIIFYLGHTMCFYVNKFHLAGIIDKRINPKFESILSIGVDEMSWDDLNKKREDWPSVSDVREYRRTIRNIVDEKIRTMPAPKLPLDWDSQWWAVLMGIEHARIHIETSSVLIRQLPIQEVRKCSFFNICEDRIEGESQIDRVPCNEMISVKGTNELEIGKPYQHVYYGWDVEYGTNVEAIENFTVSKFLVSNAEFLEFVNDRGYENEKWWTTEGNGWKNYKQAKHPVFWVRDEKTREWKLRCMLEEIPMPWDWPVEVNYLEAKAFCNWKSATSSVGEVRLPTEAEWFLLRTKMQNNKDMHEWGINAPGNINLEYFASSCPINMFSQTTDGICDVIGNVWQHTETPVDAFRGYRTHKYYDDFSLPTFDTKHNMIKGGSWISTGNEATIHARYAFRRHFFQHAGFRYVHSSQAVKTRTPIYESEDVASQYIEAHYGNSYLGVEIFPKVTASLCNDYASKLKVKKGRALDLGCSVGRGTFELAKHFDYVLGLDFSANFIRAAIHLQKNGSIRYSLVDEGDLKSTVERTLEELVLHTVVDKVEFYQGDACNLDPKYTNYDLVLAGNLLDRLYAPYNFLSTIHSRINPGGLLVMASPYTWTTEHTSKDAWIGGFKDEKTGERVTGFNGVKTILSEHFELVDSPRDIQFVIREHARKFQHNISQLSVWKKK